MRYNRDELCSRFVDGCRAWYNIDEGPFETQLPLVSICTFHSRQEKYALSKKAKLWGIESHEYLYVFSVPVLTPELVKVCTKYALETALPKVQPNPEHMYSYITAVFVADVMQDETVKAVKRSKFFKSYKLSVHGASALRTVGVDLRKGLVVTNPCGRESGKFFKKAFKE